MDAGTTTEKDTIMAKGGDKTDEAAAEKPVEEQAREQTGQRQIRLRVDEREMGSSYANAFRTNGTAEEVMLDFGLNLVNPASQGEGWERSAIGCLGGIPGVSGRGSGLVGGRRSPWRRPGQR
jgi:hypothetical protein